MAIVSGQATSRRGYLSQTELAQFANITIVDTSEADDVISQAEEILDSYIRRADKFISRSFKGVATDGGSEKTTIIDTSGDTPFTFDDGYFTGCEVEIVAGTNAGERRKISGYDKSTQTITVANAFTSQIDSTSVYQIYQLGLFPRYEDVFHLDSIYYKRIPESIKRATAAQVEYIIEKGDSFFKGGADFKSESIDDYSYERGDGSTGKAALIAPKARGFLRGFLNRIGELKAENPTNL
jgi:hypothetical protein